MTVCFSEKHEGLAPVSGRSMMADVRWLMSARKAV